MISISNWPGLATNASPYAIPPGATTQQRNLQSLVPGKVTPRKGLTPMSPSATDKIIKMFLFQDGLVSRLIYQDSQGRIYSA